MANPRWKIGVVVVLIVIGFSSVGLYLFARDAYSEQEIRELIDTAYGSQRPGGGRLSGARYTPTAAGNRTSEGLGRAQIILLRQPGSEIHHRLQGFVYLAAGDWQSYIDATNPALPEGDSATLNNLGASFLALSDKDPTYLLNALDAFDRASKSDPKAPEPLFNLVITYKRLRFPRLAEETSKRYAAVDPNSMWYRELVSPIQIDEAATMDRLRHATETNDLVEAQRLFETNTELCRRAAMQFALSKEQESEPLLHFIAAQMERRFGDKTISAMLAPLFTDQKETTVAVRDSVNRGAQLYQSGNFPESLASYSVADKLAAKTDSLFDRLWIDLNRVDTQIRVGQIQAARESLLNIVATARKNGFVWLTARALSVYGYTIKLTASYGEMMNLLSEADHTFKDIEAPHDRIRVLYYLSAYRDGAGDHDEALRLALECLRLTNKNDIARIPTLDWLIGSILYRRGMPKQAVLFAKESVDQSHEGQYAGVEFSSAITLAQLYESLLEYKLAEEYLRVADAALHKMAAADSTRGELLLGIVKARIDLNQGRYTEAESLLQRNLNIYSQQPFSATRLLSQSLMLSGQVYSRTGRVKAAAQKFNDAIDVVENDDEYLRSEGLRVKFDDERRELYDSAIDFEINVGAQDAAWVYLQKYRAKLFLELLAQFNPIVQETHTKLDRSQVQRLVPKDTQVIEYALMKDRLLIWLVTDKLFTVRSVAVKRAALEDKVQMVLQKLRTGDDVDGLLMDLGTLLVEPISKLLDPDRTITIIPDRALHGLPFAALRRPSSKQYLIQDFPIVVSPSLTHFLAGNAGQPLRDTIVAFGSQNGGSTELRELKALQDIYSHATTVAGQQVNKASFISGMRKAGVFHYVGHSVTDAADPLRSSILLDGNRSGPNSVTAVDISQQRLANNAVVILSSCDSSVGNSRDGAGVRGLTSAFLVGGAGSVVGSLWPVEASSTGELMIRFHRSFAISGMPVAKALREAQLNFLKTFPQRSHPYYWSGFEVTGNFTALR